MKWHFVAPTTVDPVQFDLSEISSCQVKEYSVTEDLTCLHSAGWSLFADLMDCCPATGKRLNEATWYLFAAQGLT